MRLLPLITLLFVFAFSSLFGQSRDTTIKCPNGGTFNIVNIYDEITCNFGKYDNGYNDDYYSRVKPLNMSVRVYNDNKTKWQNVGRNKLSDVLNGFHWTSNKYVRFKTSGLDDSIIKFFLEDQRRNGTILKEYDITFHIHDIIQIGNIDISPRTSGNSDVTINTIKQGSGAVNLEYSLDGNSYGSSNQFSNLSPGSYTVYVRDKLTGYTVTNTFNVQAPAPEEPDITGVISHCDCSGNNGSIDISMEGYETFIKFDGTTDVKIGGFDYVGKTNFTIEGRIRVSEENYSFSTRKFISLFGEDNTVEFGFINGKLSCYIATEGWAQTFEGTKQYPNDGQWHHVAVRGDGSKIELLVDGDVKDTFSKSYSKLKVDSGGAKDILVGDGVWGQSNEAFKGDIARLAFWEKYLSNDEMDALQLMGSKWLSGEEDGLIAGYNINRKEGDRLIAVAPAGATNYDGELSAPIEQWQSWVEEYSWTGPNGYKSEGVQDISHLKPGDYTVTVNYGYSGVVTTPIIKTFEVELQNNLTVDLTDPTVETEGCEGDIINLSSAIGGGVAEKNYIWVITSGSDTKEITGQSDSFTLPLLESLEFNGNRKVRLKVQSGVCVEESKDKTLNIHKKIKTKPITHKKEKKK